MCNQCEDLRRIHGDHVVWVVMKDRQPVMQFLERSQAERTIKILAQQDENAFWQIVRDSSRVTRWDG